MSPAYGASFTSARHALAEILSVPAHEFLIDDTTVAALPSVESRDYVTDAHVVALASRYAVKLATLDERLCRVPWAANVAFLPLTG
jgi:predicted nucleic acid-binding protein